MRFIHTADWHLGRLFHGQHLTQDQAYVLEQFHTVVRESGAQAVLIAGDVYDRAVPPTEAVALLDETLARLLLEDKVQVILTAGNHDSAERLGFASRLLAAQGLFVRGQLTADLPPVVLEDAFGPVYFQPFTYAEPALVRAVFGCAEIQDFDAAMAHLVAVGLRQIPANSRRVALAHAFIAGGSETESERPLSVGGAVNVSAAHFKPFHYTALGHLHNPQTAGNENIRYSGSLLKYSFDEADQKKGIYIVDLDEKGAVSVEKISMQPKRDVCRIKGFFDEIRCNRQKYPESEDYTLVELLDTQAILDVHGQLEKIYPNLMQVERPNLNVGGTLREERLDYRSKSEVELFGDFFRQMTDEMLDEKQKTLFARTVDELVASQREVKI